MEDVLILVTIFSFIALVIKMAFDYGKWKKLHDMGDALPDGKTDKSLGVSELKFLIRDAVQEANQPLLERIEYLEGQLTQDRGMLKEKAPLKQLAEPVSEDKD